MDRREFLTSQLLLGLGLGTLLTACDGGDGTDGSAGRASSPRRRAATAVGPPGTAGGPPGTVTVARSSALRRAADADPAAAVAAVNGLGTALFGQLAKAEAARNLVLSPVSVAVTMAMVREGAQGATAIELDRVLRSAGASMLSPSMNTLDQVIASRSGARPDPTGTGAVDITLKLANSLWGQQGTSWQPTFLDRLATYYGAGLRLAPFADDPGRAVESINTWVREQTGGRIPELLSDGSVDDLTRLVLVNAIYLKAPWLSPFQRSATTEGSFTRAEGTAVQARMMHSSGELAYATGDDWVAVDLPYAGYELTMSVVLPEPGRLAAVQGQLTSGLLDDVVGDQTLTPVRLALPRWNTASAVPLAEPLRALGLATAFDRGRADFRGMTTAEQLALGAVQHQANISVDEAGTEAAAATAATMQATAAPVEPPVDVVVDRPFLFFIRDVPTGALLFLGRVADPSGR